MTLRRSRMGLFQYVSAPSVRPSRGALCLTCGRTCDSEELVEGYPGESTYARVLVRHHGAEELRQFDFGSTNWDHHDLRSMMQRTHWFDPVGDGMGLGKRALPVHDDDDLPTPPMSFVPVTANDNAVPLVPKPANENSDP